MSKIVILDNGHGGMIGGQYQTAGKRSPNWGQGVLYEGAFNRWVTWLLMRELDYMGVPYYHVSPEQRDITLAQRVSRVNELYASNPNVYLLSIHANAGGGTGIEGFTSKGDTASDPISQVFLTNFEKEFVPNGWEMRFDLYDGDKDKEADYYILRKTRCPAFLIELGFMDYKRDYDKLWCKEYQQQVAINLSQTIKQLYNE